MVLSDRSREISQSRLILITQANGSQDIQSQGVIWRARQNSKAQVLCFVEALGLLESVSLFQQRFIGLPT